MIVVNHFDGVSVLRPELRGAGVHDVPCSQNCHRDYQHSKAIFA